MTNKPILFNTEMVKSIQEGRKTQTRRLIKDFAGEEITSILKPDGSYGKYGTKGWRGMLPDRGDGNEYCIEVRPPCEPGDILWVRETWCKNKNPNSQYFGGYEYRADYEGALCQDLITWRPSIHMPKEAARIFLRVKDVRVERLQDITEEQAEKEGCSAWRFHITCGPFGNYDEPPEEFDAVEDFQRVWDTTIKPADRDVYGWDANPWVWVIEFERCEKPEGWYT